MQSGKLYGALGGKENKIYGVESVEKIAWPGVGRGLAARHLLGEPRPFVFNPPA